MHSPVRSLMPTSKIEPAAVSGFFVLREWLDPDRLPPLAESLARIEHTQG